MAGTLIEKTVANADGQTFTKSVVLADANGNAILPGRAAASASNPVVISNEDLSALSGLYSTVAPYAGATTAGRAVAIVATVAGTATLTFVSGTLVVPVAVGLAILPFACTNAVQTTGTMTLYKLT